MISQEGSNELSETTISSQNHDKSIAKQWEPKFHIHKATSILFFLGVIFNIVAVVLMYSLQKVAEIVVDYTHCQQYGNVNRTCFEIVLTVTDSCYCEVPVFINSDIEAPVTMFYGLTNFYQNHRSYIMSKDRRQLSGILSKEVARECKPYDMITINGTTKIIAPCGAIANSMFSDKLTLYSDKHGMYVPVINTGIVWPKIKQNFKNPPGPLKEAFKNFAKPLAWRKNIWELDIDPANNGFENEDFIVWMQPATLSSFRKTYRRVEHTNGPFLRGLPKGDYKLKVDYYFPVTLFQGTKSFIIASTSSFGVRNFFMSSTFLFVGCFCIFLSVIFIIIRVRFPNLIA